MDMPRLSVRAVGQKAALDAVLKESAALGRSAKVIADGMGISPQFLSQAADMAVDVHLSTSRVPSLLMALPREARTLTNYWCGLQGAVAVELPRPMSAETSACQLSALACEFGALLIHHAECTSDGVWTAKEVETMRPIAERLAALSLAQLAYAESQVAK